MWRHYASTTERLGPTPTGLKRGGLAHTIGNSKVSKDFPKQVAHNFLSIPDSCGPGFQSPARTPKPGIGSRTGGAGGQAQRKEKIVQTLSISDWTICTRSVSREKMGMMTLGGNALKFH